VGKSTLFNMLVGERLSIVTPKPQTTRNNVLGILTSPTCQIMFLDTPGLLDPRYRLQEVMRKQILHALEDVDVLLGIVDASDVDASFDRDVVRTINAVDASRVLVLNKVDLVGADQVDRSLKLLRNAVSAEGVIPVSALTGQNVPQLLSTLEGALPFGPRFYSDDALTEQPERFFVAELVREEIFAQLRQEIPYSIAVEIDEFREEGTKAYISANIVVERNSQKGIVIGSRGRTLKAVGKGARKKIESFMGRPVYLDLHVKVYENWRKKDTALRRFGYLT
jgi:GTP-binding protein Era